jgi:uncharacterized alkaline shock family protein YloU
VKGRLQGITVYALVGKSGTGKSFRAKLLAEKLGISYIIDDGLLIHETSIIAGKSAKKEKLYLSAIKTAIFSDSTHRKEVAEAIQRHKVKKILLLGTSDKMVNRVTEELGLPPITQVINIEEIASKEEIQKAIKSRSEEGKHVIAVPAIEIKRDYSQILSDSIRIFFRGNRGGGKGEKVSFFDKSIVQPNFQADNKTTGNVSITSAALTEMILHCIDEYDADVQMLKIKVKRSKSGYRIDISVGVPYGKKLADGLHGLRSYIQENLQRHTGIIFDHLEISVDKIRSQKSEPLTKQLTHP